MSSCHALGCCVPIDATRLMCHDHWRLVPDSIKADIDAAYRPGQAQDKRVTVAYLQAAAQSVILVAKQTGHGRTIPALWPRLAAGDMAVCMRAQDVLAILGGRQ